MRFLRLIGTVALVAGAALVGVGIYRGEVEVALFIIFPVLVSTGGVGAMGMVLITLGVMALVFEPILSGRVAEKGGRGEGTEGGGTEFGGVVLVGPIPIIFGSSPRGALMAAAVAIIVLALLLLMVLG